ncbi:MAG: hypothetical protein RLZZ505_33 [Verrucomicrobiota bacterium]|jgi:hypothetical protein
MKDRPYLSRIAIARSTKSSRSSESAYAQVDRMAKSTNGPFTTKVSEGSGLGRKKTVATTRISAL